MKRVLFLILSFVFLCGGEVEIEKKAIEAFYAKSSGNYDLAIKLYKELFDKTKDKEFLLNLVDSYYQKGDFDTIISLINDNYQKYPSIAQKLLEYEVYGFLKAGDLESAKNVVKLKMQKSEFYYNMLAYIASCEGDNDKEEQYLEGLFSFKSSEKNLLSLVSVLIRNGKYDKAISYLKSYLLTNKPSIKVYRSLAYIYRSVGDFDDLFNVYDKLSTLDKEYSKMELLLALRFKLDKLKYVLKKYPSSLENELILNENEKKVLAKEVFFLLKERLNKHYLNFLLHNLGYLDLKEEDIAFLASVVNKFNNEEFYLLFGKFLIKRGDKRGIDFLRLAFLMNNSIDNLWNLGFGLYKVGECKRAWKLIKDVNFDKNKSAYKELIKRCANDFAKNNK